MRDVGTIRTDVILAEALPLDTPRPAKDIADRDRLVREHLPLVRRLCWRFRGAAEPLEDLFQVGSVGLLKAAEKYDPDRAVPFIAFAVPVIVGEIKNHLRERGSAVKIPRKLQHQKRVVGRAVEELSHQLSRSPTVKEIAKATGISEQDVYDTFEIDSYRRPLSLDAAYLVKDSDAADRGHSILEIVGSEAPKFDEVTIRTDIAIALGCLDKRERKILHLKFNDELSQRRIGELMGMSQAHVSRLQRNAINKLRVNLDRYESW